ncbi:MAG: GNAT family N-acetyltransferase [Oscillospiraceae bacterium]|nr:GNAT family N-acetyltransferase [Oscillospiraceae bacterium]
MKLRPYKPADADTILSWVRDEETFRRWVTDRYPHYPITPAEMNEKYLVFNGDCPEPDNFYPMTACDENGILGHLILRFTDAEKTVVRFGFVIVDDARRGAGLGRRMLGMAVRYAAEFLKVKKITIGVLENNPGALRCYLGVGFQEVPQDEPVYYDLLGQHVRCKELEMDV